MNPDRREQPSTAELAAECWHRLASTNTADRAAWITWLKESPLHVRELLLAATWDGVLSDRSLGSRLDVDALIEQARINIVEMPPSDLDRQHLAQHRRPRVRHWKLAASVAALALTALLSFAIKVAWFDRIIATDSSEWRAQVLRDGTMVRIGPRTQLRLAFDDNKRLVRLARGEAFFDVRKDSRPFIVRTQFADVRAVGTQFGVTRRGNQVVVTVAEGQVAVARCALAARNREPAGAIRPAQTAGHVTVAAGEQVRIAPFGALTPKAVDTQRELAWAQKQLIFRGDTLVDAASEFNRRNNVQIEIQDTTPATRISGIFLADDPETFAEMAAYVSGATVKKEPGILRIERNSTGPAVRPEPEADDNDG